MNRLILLVAMLSLTGCFKTVELAPEWKPLKIISERPDMLAKDTISTTIGSTLYVADIDDWFERNPEGSPKFIGIMKHEQEHSKRQFDKGVFLWLTLYTTDKAFMWDEEQRGYYLALTHPGYQYIPEAVAKNMSNYRNAFGQRMIDYDKALEWVLKVRNGTWTPD
jgi:hypothetical protein